VILALSTTTEVASIALATGDRIVQTRFESRRELARTLMSRIDRLCLDAGVGPGSLTAIAVDRGPGSFTGARIGVATARALASALGLAIRTETSLALLCRAARHTAPSCGPHRLVLAAVESKADEMFVMPFSWLGAEASAPIPLAFEDAPEFARRHAGALLVGAPWRNPAVPRSLTNWSEPAGRDWDYPDAATLATSATGELPPERVEPLYVRVSQPQAAEGQGPRRWRPGDVFVRPLRGDDVEDIVAMERQCFITPWPRGDLVADIRRRSGSYYIIAEDSDGSPVGYAVVWFVFDRGHVASVAVLPEWRRKGVAKRLMLELFAACVARGMRTVSLEYRASNRAAAQLYEELGFQVDGYRHNYYTDTGEDAVSMILPDLLTADVRQRLRRIRITLEAGH
jgi:ribosomal-protein-alanine N-acetyltransferase